MNTPKERPILFSAPMVRAILDGRKTQTRRIAKVTDKDCKPGMITPLAGFVPRTIANHISYCPYGKTGDRLWVRETFKQYNGIISYKADGNWISDFNDIDNFNPHENIKWKRSIHMPRSASRILLEITGVRVERLQDISEEDAIAEGISRVPFRPCDGWPICDGYMVGKDDGVTGLAAKASTAYKKLWESINGPGSWDMNPFVWVVEFRRIN